MLHPEGSLDSGQVISILSTVLQVFSLFTVKLLTRFG